MEATHTQYLKAMGIQVWVQRAEETTQITVPDIPESIPAQPINIQPEETPINWDTLQQKVATCTACALHSSRTQTVFGIGNQQADLMLIGEAPGADEDAQGEPFVGRAGKLLTAMLYAIDIKRESVYIANVIKCRPPENRNPNTQEMTCCNAFLKQQIALIDPKLIIAVGRIAAHHLLAIETAIGKIRGQCLKYNNIPLIPIYHPAYLLRRPSEKRHAWKDLQFIRQTLTEL